MKRIGLLGGMSWESSREYYRLINEGVRDRLGGLHSADLVLTSLDFGPLSEAMDRRDWPFIEARLEEAARRTVAAGAELLLIGTNTMHKMAPAIERAARPALLIHIGDCAAEAARRRGYTRVALMGTRFTMEEDFYSGRLRDAGLTVLLPEGDDRDWIDRLIFSELCVGVFDESSRRRLAGIVAELRNRGADAVVLGCTELPMLLAPEDSPLPILDTMALHAAAAVSRSLDPAEGL